MCEAKWLWLRPAAATVAVMLVAGCTLMPVAARAQSPAQAQAPSPAPAQVQESLLPSLGDPAIKARVEALAAPAGRVAAGRRIATHVFLPRLYAALGYRLAWSDKAKVAALSEAITRSWEDGLTPADFHDDYVKAEAAAGGSATSPASAIERDIALSDAFVRLLTQLYFGKVKPNGLDSNWNFERPTLSEDPAPQIAAALQTGDIASLVDTARLKHPLYVELKAMLQQYTNFEAAGGWPMVPEGAALKPGQSDPRIAALRARLTFTGQYDAASPPAPDLFDAPLVDALKEFQGTHDLDTDGVLGPDTVKELNITAAERVDQIRVNLERCRWLLRKLEPDMVAVNVAGFYLHLFLKSERVWTTRVIVGQTYTKTPIFQESMKTVVLNPEWNVPRGIVRNEIFPKMVADPGYLDAHNYYLTGSSGPVAGGSVNARQYTAASFPYGVVQRSGPRNALGQVKFLFPNKYSVYLHDTPGRQMFAKSARTFSHGCIRVEDPLKLAELILADRKGYDRGKIDALLATGKQQFIALPQPLPVFILYWTVDPSPTIGAAFHRDIYGRDAFLLKALDAPFVP